MFCFFFHKIPRSVHGVLQSGTTAFCLFSANTSTFRGRVWSRLWISRHQWRKTLDYKKVFGLRKWMKEIRWKAQSTSDKYTNSRGSYSRSPLSWGLPVMQLKYKGSAQQNPNSIKAKDFHVGSCIQTPYCIQTRKLLKPNIPSIVSVSRDSWVIL